MGLKIPPQPEWTSPMEDKPRSVPMFVKPPVNGAPKMGRGPQAIKDLKTATLGWLESLGMELPQQPVTAAGAPVRPHLPDDITGISSEELGMLHGQFVAMQQYANGQLGLVDVDWTEIDYEATMVEAQAGFSAEGQNADQRKYATQLDPAVQAKAKERMIRRAKKQLLGVVADGYDKGAKACSREMTRRGMEVENS